MVKFILISRDCAHGPNLLAGPTLSPAGNNQSLVSERLPVLKEQLAVTPNPAAHAHLLKALLDSTEDAVLHLSPDGTIASWSRGAECLYGYPADEVIGRALTQFLPTNELPAFGELLANAQKGVVRPHEIMERLRKNGPRIRVETNWIAVRNEEGELTEIVERARELNGAGGGVPEEGQLRLLMEQMPGVVWTTDRDLRVTTNWGSGLPQAMIRAGSLVGASVGEFLGAADLHATPIAEHYEALRGASSHFEYRRNNRFLDIHLEPLRSGSGEIIGCIGLGVDITERKETEEEVRFQATHDAMTGLANYREFMDRLEREVRRADRSRHGFTILLLDLDGLKKINDRHGHLAGNRALMRLATVMKANCRSTDLAARYGGDEFAEVLIESDLGMAKTVAERIQASLQEDGREPPLSVSIGIGSFPSDGRTAQELLEAADHQLYQAKKLAHRRNLAAGQIHTHKR